MSGYVHRKSSAAVWHNTGIGSGLFHRLWAAFLVCMIATTASFSQTANQMQTIYTQAKSANVAEEFDRPGDIVTCLGAWAALGVAVIEQPQQILQVHGDLTEPVANAHFQHWWHRSVQIYTAMGDNGSRFKLDFETVVVRYISQMQTQGIRTVLEMAGRCFVVEGQREIQDSNVPLRKYLTNLATQLKAPKPQSKRTEILQFIESPLYAGICNLVDVENATIAGAQRLCLEKGGTYSDTKIISSEPGGFGSLCFTVSAQTTCEFPN